ncbi:acyl-CoA dehydrogenase family protein [Halovenus salina]|uniref:Acyl-CoA dehydrogenase family protein n=1 Tax=Halovenus salina TaxID=1510225 RepID=A0ABD5VW35_9EURY|nr:acyl-CoA dehydrogenase family protein [Halovenus salina]
MDLLSEAPIPDATLDTKAAAREFASEHVRPRSAEFDAPGEYPLEVVQEAQSAGIAGVYVPEEHGGAGWTLADRLAVVEELFRADGGIGLALQLVDFGAKVVTMTGSPDQQAEWLPPVAAGDEISGLAATEPAGGSDLAGMTTTAHRDGDEYVLDGEKYWTSNGVVADWIVVYAQTGEPGHEGYSLFVVPTDTPGYDADAITDKMGLRASQQARITLDSVRVPAANRLGPEGSGFYQLASFFNYGRIAVAGHGIGLAAAALETAWEYVHDRELYDEPVAEKQTVRHQLVEAREEFGAARALTWQACDHVMADEHPAFWASLAKSHATRAAENIAQTAVQLHGGEGLREQNRVNRIYRDAKYPSIYEGANAVQRDLAYGHWPEA